MLVDLGITSWRKSDVRSQLPTRLILLIASLFTPAIALAAECDGLLVRGAPIDTVIDACRKDAADGDNEAAKLAEVLEEGGWMVGAIKRSDALTRGNLIDAAWEFNKAAEKHRGEYRSLGISRSVDLSRDRMTIEKLVRRLSRYDARTSLLFYDYSDRHLRVWVISNNEGMGYLTPSVIRQSIDYRSVQIEEDDLEETLYGFRGDLGTLGRQIERAPVFLGDRSGQARTSSESSTMEDVSRLLVPEPWHSLILGSEKIFIVPTRGIGSVPFSALEVNSKPLVESVAVTVLPSLFDLPDPLAEMYPLGPESLSSLIVGNPEYGKDSQWRFPQLPGAEREAKSIARQLGVSPLIGPAATTDEVVSRLEDADIALLATHGVASFDAPLDESFLVFSGTDQATRRLTAREIQGLSLKARLVVLSACQTGLGGVHDAGIIGLARAFKIAGVDEVVVSLWNVDDKVNVELMETFFTEYGRGGVTASEALRKAMLSTRSNHPELGHWAPFVVISGTGTTIDN